MDRLPIFDLDIGIGDVWIEPHDHLELKNHLDFAGFEVPRVEVISVEQHFAEKIHAYTLLREGQNSRVKDLVDLYLIIKNEKLNKTLLRKSIEDTFDRRATHKIPDNLESPPESWRKPFEGFGVGISIDETFGIVKEFYLDHFLHLTS